LLAGAAVSDNLRRFFAYHVATSLGWDVGRAVTNVVGITLVGGGILNALRRTARRGGFTRLEAGDVSPAEGKGSISSVGGRGER
jgi:hypothetical protein